MENTMDLLKPIQQALNNNNNRKVSNRVVGEFSIQLTKVIYLFSLSRPLSLTPSLSLSISISLSLSLAVSLFLCSSGFFFQSSDLGPDCNF